MPELAGALVELVGDFFTVLGLTLQRLATLSTLTGNPLANPKWLLGLAFFALGQGLELVALGMATESTIVATGTLALVFNAFASVWVFGEAFSLVPQQPGLKGLHHWDLLNLLTLIVGSFLTVIFAPLISSEEESKFDARELRKMWFEVPFVYLNVLLLTALIVLSVLAYRLLKAKRDEDQEEHPLILAMVVAILSAFSVTLSKVVTELFTKSVDGADQFDNLGAILMIAVWVCLLVAQLGLINVGMSRYEQAVFVPMYEVLSCSLTIVAGIMYFKSYRDFAGPLQVVGFCSGFSLLTFGLHLTSQRHVPSRSEMRQRLTQHSPRANDSLRRIGSAIFFSDDSANAEQSERRPLLPSPITPV